MSDANTVVDIKRLRRSCGECVLRELCLPAGIRLEDLGQLDRLVRNRPLKTGEHLFNIAERFHSLYVIREGSVKTWVTSEQGELQILGFHLPGEIIGLDAMSDDRHQCTAEALEPTTICEVPFEHLEHVACKVPGLQRQFMRIISREVFNDHEHLVMMGSRQAMERLSLFLHSLSERRRRLGEDGNRIQLSMSRADLANYLGLVTETISRLLTRMQDEGVISVQRRDVRILDPGQLAELSGDEHYSSRLG